jgi:hypothetical protein
MTAAGGGGGGFEGIDPPLLSQLMQSMKSGVSAAAPVAAGYMSRFSALGLDTSRVSRLQQDYNWAQGQQSMLQRRYDLASHQPSGQWVNGMATSGAGELEYTTPQQAQAAGANAGQQFKDGKISATEFLALLREHEYDPDWQTGAMRAIGQEGLWAIREDDAIPYGAQGQPDMKALALAVAAALANGVTFPGPAVEDDPGDEDLTLLAPLLAYANFPPQVLATLGKEAMAPGYAFYAPEVWAALEASPGAAAMFIQQNAPQIVWYINAGDHGGGLPDDQMTAFLGVLKAGTIDIRSSDPQLGGQAVTALVKAYYDDQGAHAPSQFDALYGQVIEDYWPDVMFSITSTATDPHGYLKSPDGMHLSPDQWAAFVREAMWDPTTAAKLLANAHAQDAYWLGQANKLPGNSGDSYALQAGLVAGFFDSQATWVYNKQGSNSGAWKSGVISAIGPAVGDAISLVTEPGQWASTFATSAINFIATNVLTGVVNGLPNGSGPPAPALSTWQGTHERNAVDAFDDATPQLIEEDNEQDPAHQLQALVQSVQYYDKGSFVVKVKGKPNPQIMKPSQMSPQQLQAYNAWLNDPAVWAKTMDAGPDVAWGQGYWDYTGQENTTPQ